MSATPKVDPKDLPSLPELYSAAAAVVVVAAVLVTTAVLPAERGLDPTGVGGWLGLTSMGELKSGGAARVEPAAPQAQAAPEVAPEAPKVEGPATFRTDELALTLKPGEGAEIKAVMREGDQLIYSWASDQGELFFDFHGEPKGAPSSVFTSFEKGTLSTAEGDFEAPFEGTHGWYWKNKTASPATVTLKTSGVYASIGRK